MAPFAMSFQTIDVTWAVWVFLARNDNHMIEMNANTQFVWAYMMAFVALVHFVSCQLCCIAMRANPNPITSRTAQAKLSIQTISLARPKPAGFSLVNLFPKAD